MTSLKNNMQHLMYWAWVISILILSHSIHFPENFIISFTYSAINFIIYMCHIFQDPFIGL